MTPHELLKLASDRQLRTHELHPFNAYYGHASILRRYAGWRSQRPLKVAIEHGLVLLDDIVPELETGLVLPFFLCQADRRVAAYRRAGAPDWADAVPIGPMISYARALMPVPEPSGRRTLVAFPSHSWHHGDVSFDVDDFLSDVGDWSREFDDVKVCLYWRDILAGASQKYAERGYDLVTAGHMFDRRFLFRLLAILRSAAGVVTNEVGSHVVYAGTLGVPVWVTGQTVSVVTKTSVSPLTLELLRREAAGEAPVGAELRKLFSSPCLELTGAQREMVDEVGGAGYVKRPEQILELLQRAEAAYSMRVPARERLRWTTRTVLRLARSVVRSAPRRVR